MKVSIILFVTTGSPCLQVRSVRSINAMEWLLLPKGFDNRKLRAEPLVSERAKSDVLTEADSTVLAEAMSDQAAATTESLA